LNSIRALKDAKIIVESAFVIVNRLEGAFENLEAQKVKLYEITDILAISNILHIENILDEQTLDRIKKQMNSSKSS
ncbi:MAG: orotate phosphoribosyltransferase, partial [Nitrosotalea sp.]